jgi:hypothetical protein
MQTHSKNGIKTPKVMLATNHPIDHIDLDPTNYTQASKHQHWRASLAAELDALAKNGTWTLAPMSEATNVVGCKWSIRQRKG